MATRRSTEYMTEAGREFPLWNYPRYHIQWNANRERSEWAQRVKPSDGLINKTEHD